MRAHLHRVNSLNNAKIPSDGEFYREYQNGIQLRERGSPNNIIFDDDEYRDGDDNDDEKYRSELEKYRKEKAKYEKDIIRERKNHRKEENEYLERDKKQKKRDNQRRSNRNSDESDENDDKRKLIAENAPSVEEVDSSCCSSSKNKDKKKS